MRLGEDEEDEEDKREAGGGGHRERARGKRGRGRLARPVTTSPERPTQRARVLANDHNP